MKQKDIFDELHEQRTKQCTICYYKMRETDKGWVCDKCEIFKEGSN